MINIKRMNGRNSVFILIGLLFVLVFLFFKLLTLSTERDDLLIEVEKFQDDIKKSSFLRVELNNNYDRVQKLLEEAKKEVRAKKDLVEEYEKENERLSHYLEQSKLSQSKFLRQISSLDNQLKAKAQDMKNLELHNNKYEAKIAQMEAHIVELNMKLQSPQYNQGQKYNQQVNVPFRRVPHNATAHVNEGNVEVRNLGLNGMKFHGKEIIPRENPNVERKQPRFSVRGKNEGLNNQGRLPPISPDVVKVAYGYLNKSAYDRGIPYHQGGSMVYPFQSQKDNNNNNNNIPQIKPPLMENPSQHDHGQAILQPPPQPSEKRGFPDFDYPAQEEKNVHGYGSYNSPDSIHNHADHGHVHAGHAHNHDGHAHNHAGHAHNHDGHDHDHAGHHIRQSRHKPEVNLDAAYDDAVHNNNGEEGDDTNGNGEDVLGEKGEVDDQPAEAKEDDAPKYANDRLAEGVDEIQLKDLNKVNPRHQL